MDPAEVDARAGAVTADDLSDILFTSGTTGNPKGVMETHGATLRAYQAWSDVVGLREGDRYLIVNPFFHAFGYKAGWLAAMLTGATIHPQAVFDVDAVLERVGRERITMLPGPPTLFHTILDHPRRGEHDLSSLRLAVTGAAAIPVELILRMRDELTFETIITGYGLTESCGIATMCRYDDDPETIATTSGRAIPDVEVLVVDDAGAEVTRGSPGEVVVRGYNVMRGLLRRPVRDRGHDRRRRLAPHGRRRRHGRARVPAHHRPDQGHVHRRRVQRVSRPRSRTSCSATRRSRRRR